MYLRATVAVDPSRMTQVQRTKPTKAFAQMLHYMTLGAATPREEIETFTAVSVLQSLNRAFRELGVNDVVRLSKDDTLFYLDNEGRRDDLQEAFAHFQEKHPKTPLKPFEQLHLVLEHQDSGLSYLFDVAIRRRHRVGEYPIQIRLNAVFSEFGGDGSDLERTRQVVRTTLSSKEQATQFVEEKKRQFAEFLERLEQALRAALKVDDVEVRSDTALLRPREKVAQRPGRHYADVEDPCLGDYYGWDLASAYLWVWGETAFEEEWECRDCSLVDESGNTFLEVGSDGLSEESLPLLDCEQPLVIPDDPTLKTVSGSGYDDQLPTDDSSWLGGDAGSFDTGAGCSSCSSCGGCGGD